MIAIGKWLVYEACLATNILTGVPPDQVPVEVQFTSPSGIHRAADAFWDGGQTWGVRFSPDEVGRWSWESRCADTNSGLSGLKGEFQCEAYQGDNPLYLHGPLQLSGDRRRLSWADGTRFFWLSDTAWNGVLASKDADWRRYLETRRRQEFSAIQFVSTQWRGFGKDADGLQAFVREPGFRIVPEFFRKLDAKVAAINEQGMIAAPVMIWSLLPTDPGRALPEKDIISLARYIRARWGAYQVAWILGGDGVYGPEHEKWQRIGRAVFEGRHDRLVTLHMAGQQWSAEFFRGEPWFDFIGYQSGHGGTSSSLRWHVQGPVVENLARTPALPVINLEPNYEMHPHGSQIFSAREVRRACYWSLLLSPPAGVTLGVHPIWNWLEKKGPSPGHNLGLVEPWSAGLETPGTQSMTILRRFFESLPWERLQPAQDVLASQPGSDGPADFVAVAASEADDLTVLYLPVGGTVQLNPDKVAKASRIRWFNPRSGMYAAPATLPQPAAQLTAPDRYDWLAVLSN